jgi:hypothetical protein
MQEEEWEDEVEQQVVDSAELELVEMEDALEGQEAEQEVALRHHHVEGYVDFVVAVQQAVYAPPDPHIPHK